MTEESSINLLKVFCYSSNVGENLLASVILYHNGQFQESIIFANERKRERERKQHVNILGRRLTKLWKNLSVSSEEKKTVMSIF